MSHCDIRVLDRLGHSVSLIRAERTRSAFLKKKETANCFAVSLMPLSGEISPVCCSILLRMTHRFQLAIHRELADGSMNLPIFLRRK